MSYKYAKFKEHLCVGTDASTPLHFEMCKNSLNVECDRLYAWWSTQSQFLFNCHAGVSDLRLYDGSDLKTYL